MSSFLDREDDLRFRRTTWLLSKLGSKEKSSDNNERQGPMANALGELTALASLFVRQHEIVAVMPRMQRDTQELGGLNNLRSRRTL
jgi:hypothetical protein